VHHVQDKLEVSQRRACKVLGQSRSTQRRKPIVYSDEKPLTQRIVQFASMYGRYGYRRITALLTHEGWRVNHKRVERIWRQLGLKVPKKQPKRGRLWLNDGSTRRLRPEYKDHVWSYDFIFDRTSDGRQIKILSIIDEYTRECLMLKVCRRIRSKEVVDTLNELFLMGRIPKHIRSDNGSEFIAEGVRKWLSLLEIKPLYIEPGSPWENGFVESFHGKFRDECLKLEVFDTFWEAKVLVEGWRVIYNTIRPHSALGYLPPAPETKEWIGSIGNIYSGKSSVATPLQPCQNRKEIVYS